ncbi:MAG: TonB-dependent receptor [Pseudomonadota bacterium]
MKDRRVFVRTALCTSAAMLVPGAPFADEMTAINVPPQPLQSALVELSAETGLKVIASDRITRELQSPGAQGTMSLTDAVAAIVDGTGLTARAVDGSSAVVVTQGTDAIDEDFELPPIIVSGELIERSIFDTPTSVSVTTGEELESRGDPSIYQAIDRAANVARPLGDKGFSIRGVDQRGFGAGSGLLVSTQVDGVALPDNQSTFLGAYSTWDLDQVEILRGPQSTQQGRNALAGAVVIRSNDPSYDQEYKARLEYGSRDTRGASILANTPLIADTLAFRFSADYFTSDGWVDNPTRGEDDYDARESTTYRAKLRWDPSTQVETILSYTYSDSSMGEDLVADEFFPPDRKNFANDEAEESIESQIWDLRVNWDINDRLRLESETNYYSDDYYRQEDIDGPSGDSLLTVGGDADSFEQDLRLRFSTDTVEGVVGMFYMDAEYNRPNGLTARLNSFLPPPVGSFVPDRVTITRTGDVKVETENFAIYGEGDVDLGAYLPGLTLTVGARYDRETIKNEISDVRETSEDALAFIPPPLQPLVGPLLANFLAGEPGVQTKATYEAFLPKLGVTYDWTQDIATSFTIQRGYRAGGAQQNLFTAEINEYDPEYTWNYELAFRGSFRGDRIRTFANVFYTSWEDQQVNVQGPSGDDLDVNTTNAGESEYWGGEVTVQAAATPDLDVYATIGYVKSNIIDFENNGVDFSGNEFPQAPQWTGSLGGTYSFANGLRLGLDASYTDSAFFNVDNDPRYTSDAHWVVNAQAAYDWRGLTAGLYVRNLLDEDYAVTRRPGGGATNAVVGEPLTVGAYLEYEY